MSDEADIDAYFERIGFAGSIAPTLATLEQLHGLHPAAIPFENLSPLMGSPVRLELRNLEQKLLFERRGGYCFEQNLLFKAELEALGFSVRALGARVLWGYPPEAERPISHLVLAVEISGVTYLADVGFGTATLTAPLRLRADVEQQTPHGTYRLTGGEAEWQLEMQIGEEWKPVYAFDLTEKSLEDVQAMNEWVSTKGTQRENLLVSRAEKGRRLALRNARLRIYTIGGETETRMLGSVEEIREALTGLFGINLPSNDKLDPALEQVLALDPPD